MNDIDGYIKSLPPDRQEKIKQIVAYIRQKYPNFPESCDYSPKWKFPVFRHPSAPNYIAIASQKSQITIHFGRYHCSDIIAAADKRIKTGVGCAKISDSVPFPMDSIEKAIDACFSATTQFRPAVPGDAAALKSMARRVIQANYTPFLGEDLVRSFIESGQADQEIDDGLNTCTLMVSDDGIVGFAIVKAEVLHLIMVAPEFQGKGYGSKLLAYIEQQMFAEHPAIQLQTFANNAGAIAFYQKHGWREAERQAVDGMDIPLVVFQKCR